jgi:hypothetical protein
MTAEISIHPMFQARILARAEETKRRYQAESANCIASLESAIATLKTLRATNKSQDIQMLTEVYEWAHSELRDCDHEDAHDMKRIAGIARLLQRFVGVS